MTKKSYVLGMTVLLIALLALAGVARSAMWVGAEGGGNFVLPTVYKFNGHDPGTTQFKPAVIGGMTLGYDFINAGFGAYAWPDWAKYFSVATDITYNRLSVFKGDSGIGAQFCHQSRGDGFVVAWTFMLIAHYGFLHDSEVPSGRINPYIGVGPAIMWTVLGNAFNATGRSTNVALVVEPGIRFMCLKNVSIDTACRYRHAAPSWDVGHVRNLGPITIEDGVLNMLSFLVRANYHF